MVELKNDQNGKILIVVAKERFQDFEYSIPREIFEKNGYKITVASLSEGRAKGRFGLEVEVDIVIKNVVVNEYHGIVLVGGSGAVVYQGNKDLNVLLEKFIEQGKVIGAICIAPTILALGGFLKGKKATVWNGDGTQAKLLEKNGAHYENKNVVIDEQIITADGPESAREFAEKMVSLINFIN